MDISDDRVLDIDGLHLLRRSGPELSIRSGSRVVKAYVVMVSGGPGDSVSCGSAYGSEFSFEAKHSNPCDLLEPLRGCVISVGRALVVNVNVA